METIEFQLSQEYIPLNQLLKLLNVCDSGGMANMVIINGDVLVNNQTAFEKRKKIRKNDIVAFNGFRIIVK